MKYFLAIIFTLFTLIVHAQVHHSASELVEQPPLELKNAFGLPHIRPNAHYEGVLALSLSDYDLKGFQGTGAIKNLRISSVRGVPQALAYKANILKYNPKDYALILKLRGTITHTLNRRIAVDLAYDLDYGGQTLSIARSIDNISLQTPNATRVQQRFLSERLFSHLSASPNPFRSHADISFDAKADIAGQFQMLDIVGRIVCQKAFSAHRGHNVLILQRSDCERFVPSGLYIYRLQALGESFSKRLIIL